MNILVALVWMFAGLWNGLWWNEVQIASSPVECGIGLSAQGEPVFSFCGKDRDTLVLTPNQKQAIAGGGVFTHNHPDGCLTFSFDDVDFAARLYLQEIRVVTFKDSRVGLAVLRYPAVLFSVDDQIVTAEFRRQVGHYRSECEALDATWRALSRVYPFDYFILIEARAAGR